MCKSFVDEFTEPVNFSPLIPFSTFLDFIQDICAGYDSGEILSTDYLTIGIEDGAYTVHVYSPDPDAFLTHVDCITKT